MDNLKPCPFCGGEASVAYNAKRKIYKSDKYVSGNVVYCNVCDARIFSSINRAVEMWNRRISRKVGHWKMVGETELEGIPVNPLIENRRQCYQLICSECGYELLFDIEGHSLSTNYCPNCGVKIEGEYRMDKSSIIEILKAIIAADKADGCFGCAFIEKEEWELPCADCKRNCKDYWRMANCPDVRDFEDE